MGQNKAVLVVDDDQDFRELLAEQLRLEGWTAFVAASAEDAVGLARTTAIDFVVTDVLLPRGTGMALEQTFKADPVLADVSFVFMSGWAPHLEQVGRDRALSKPFDIADLCALLAQPGFKSRVRT